VTTERDRAVGWHAEIERKFLLARVPDHVHRHESVEIEQGWLSGAHPVRLRRERSATGVRLLRTEKRGHGAARIEREAELAPDEFDVLWPATAARRVSKRRWRVTVGAFCWEIDDFRDRTLALAEVELPAIDIPLTLPDWLAPCVVREVTDDPDYLNVNLAVEAASSPRVPTRVRASLR